MFYIFRKQNKLQRKKVADIKKSRIDQAKQVFHKTKNFFITNTSEFDIRKIFIKSYIKCSVTSDQNMNDSRSKIRCLKQIYKQISTTNVLVTECKQYSIQTKMNENQCGK